MNKMISILLSCILLQSAPAQNKPVLLQKAPKKTIYEEVVVVGHIKAVKKAYPGFCPGKITYNDSMCRLFPGTFGCPPVRDTVPGKVTVVIQPNLLLKPAQDSLIIVDGVILPDGKISSIDPANIETIDILKPGSTAGFVACRPVRKVILITTKTKMLRIPVTDRISGIPVSNATVRILFQKGRQKEKTIIADSAGYFSMESKWFSRVAALYISSIGYQEQVVNNISNTAVEGIRMEREMKLPEIATVFASGTHRVYCGFSFSVTVRKEDRPLAITASLPLVYPNPAKRGNSLQVQFAYPGEGSIYIRLTSISGQPIFQTSAAVENGLIQTSVQLPQNIAAGIYLLTAVNAKGQPAFQQRVVVE